MGQIRGKKAHIDACNLRSLSSFGTPAAGQHILVSTDNSATADGQGNFDCYIVGNGTDAATARPLNKINPEIDVLGQELTNLIHELSEISTAMEEITPSDADGVLSGYYVTTAGVVGSWGSGAIWYKYFDADTKITYKTTFYASGVNYSANVPVNNAQPDVKIIFGQGEGEFVIPAGNYLWWSGEAANPSKTLVSQEVETYGEIKDFATKEDLLPITTQVQGMQLDVDNIEDDVAALSGDLAELTRELSEDLSGTLTPENADGVLANHYVTASNVVRPYNNYSVWYKFFEADTKITYKTTSFASGIDYSASAPVEDATPDTSIIYGSGEGEFTIPAGNYLWCSGRTDHPEDTIASYEAYGDIIDFDNFATKEDLAPIDEDKAFVTSMAHALRLRQRGDVFAPMLVDWMQYCHWLSEMTSIAQMSVVSSTETTITLSSTDAETITAITPIVVEFSDGTYKVMYFGPANGSTITRCAWETQDLTNAVSIQSIHDTVKGGGGIHLSQTGYLGIAQFTAEEIVKQIAHRDNYVTGFEFYNYTQSGTGLYAPNGDKVADITTDMATGYGVDGSIACCEIRKNYANNYNYNQGWLLNMFFILQQNAQGKTATFTLPAYGVGYVEVIAGLTDSTGNRIGGATIELFADDVSQGTRTLYQHCMRYTFTGVSCKKTLKLVITISSNSPTGVVIGSFGFWNLASDVPAVDLTGKKIAVLGDSWTQFPNTNDGLADHASYNERVVRPNGTDGDGFGYFPKELARITGASVDNWGKSNMRADNWGLPMIEEVLDYADYDYLIVEFFINDFNAQIPVQQWANNIAKICRKCYSRGVRPIVIAPCRVNSPTTHAPYWIKMFRGVEVI